jgi:NAD(P)-dependent dehydrogenase (short-subunit alcohol dehydrogenase family)
MKMSGVLSGKVALVTGSGSGLGRGIAEQLARAGADIAVAEIDAASAEKAAEELSQLGVRARAYPTDVSSSAAVDAAFAAAARDLGRLDVVVNNAGISRVGPHTHEVTDEDWHDSIAVMQTGVFFGIRAAGRIMMAQGGGGSIINISSIASIRHVGISYVSYNASKAAMNQMTRSTAVEFASKHVRVNAILPGLMKTPMVEHSAGLAASYAAGDVEAMWRARDAQVPMGHMGDAWDVANAALFLASDESKYVTGLELVVDGGITCKVG